jgi:hypothetical protein
VSSNADDQLFAWIKARLEAISNITDIIPASDAIVRDDWPVNMRPSPPRIEYNPLRFGISEKGDIYQGQFGITVIADRSIWFGSGSTPENEGDLWTLESEVIASLSNAAPSGITGYTVSPIQWTARRRPTETPDDLVGRRLNFGVTMYPGSSVPLSGGDADLTGLSSNLKVVGWNISVDGSRNTDFDTAERSAFALRLDKPIATVSIRVRIVGDGSRIFPAYNSRQNVTFYVDSNSGFNEPNMLIGRVQWIPNADQTAEPQYANIIAYIDNQNSAVFTGAMGSL